jgi:hypothetical protein
MIRRALQILWPAFAVAGVLEMLVFAAVDPGELHWFGGAPIEWSTKAVYTFTFLLFWGAIATAGAITALLAVESDPAPGAGARD